MRWNAAPRPGEGTGPSPTSRPKGNGYGTPGQHAVTDANTALPPESHAAFIQLLNRALQAMDSSPRR